MLLVAFFWMKNYDRSDHRDDIAAYGSSMMPAEIEICRMSKLFYLQRFLVLTLQI